MRQSPRGTRLRSPCPRLWRAPGAVCGQCRDEVRAHDGLRIQGWRVQGDGHETAGELLRLFVGEGLKRVSLRSTVFLASCAL